MTPAFAITHNGAILVDTVRSSEGEAKSAAIKLAKQPGVSWRDLAARGHAVLAVAVTPIHRRLARPATSGTAAGFGGIVHPPSVARGRRAHSSGN
jgi:hypothetical protein